MRKPLINPGIIKRLKSFFAIIQDTDTATRYIPAGKYVLYKNIACHASQNIESGDTLALGTNLVTDSDGFINCLNDKLGTKVNTSDIVNALTSTNSTKPLSAAQGKVLNDGLTTLNSKLTITSSTCTSSYGTVSYRRYGQIVLLYFNISNLPASAWTDVSTDIPHAASAAYGLSQTGDGRNEVATYATGNTLKFYGRGTYTSALGTLVYLTDS